MLTGLLALSEGTVEVCGFDVRSELPSVQRVMGVCPQHDLLWPRLSAAETLFLFAAVKGIPKAHRAEEVDRVLREVRLRSAADRLVHTFSGGMKRRVSVAIAALGRPRVLYLDEPTTGMDPVHRVKVWRLIQRLKSSASIVL